MKPLFVTAYNDFVMEHAANMQVRYADWKNVAAHTFKEVILYWRFRVTRLKRFSIQMDREGKVG